MCVHMCAQVQKQGLGWDVGASTRMDGLTFRQASVLAGVCVPCAVCRVPCAVFQILAVPGLRSTPVNTSEHQ